MKNRNPNTLVTGVSAFLFFVATIVMFFVIGLSPDQKETSETDAWMTLLFILFATGFLITLILTIVFAILNSRKKKKSSLWKAEQVKEEKEIECPSCHEKIPASSTFCPKCGKSILPSEGEEETALPLYEEQGTPDFRFEDYFSLFAYAYSTADVFFGVLLVADIVMILFGLLYSITALWTAGLTLALLNGILFFSLLIIPSLSFLDAQKKKQVVVHTRVYENCIVTDTDMDRKGKKMHDHQIVDLNHFQKAKENKRGFYFASIKENRIEATLLKRDALNETVKQLLSNKIQEGKKKSKIRFLSDSALSYLKKQLLRADKE